MNIKISILILFLILSINNVYAETGNYELEYDITTNTTVYNYNNAGVFSYNPGSWSVNDVVAMNTLSFLEANIPLSQWEGSDDKSSFDWLSLYSDEAHTNFIGTGVYGFIKSPATNSVRIQLHIGTNLEWGVLTGTQKIYIQTSTSLKNMDVKYVKVASPASQGILISRHGYTELP